MNKVLLKIDNVTKKFIGNKNKEINALRGVSLELHEGEIFGLLGENGAGKTTLSSIIASLISPTSGDVFFKDNSIYKNLFDYRKAIGFCPQKPNLFPTLTIRQNLEAAASLYGLSDSAAKAKVDELIKKYGLGKYQDQFISSLSGGYKQRASIARALVHSPKLILFDEPTVGLDPHIRRALWQEIKDLKKMGVTIILTTHYLDEAEILSDRICVMAQGEVKFVDTSENLKKNLNKESLEDVLVSLTSHEE